MRARDLEDNEQWAPVSDLMAALMLIFMFIAIIFIRAVVIDDAEGSTIAAAVPATVTMTVHIDSASNSGGEAETYREECDKIYRELKDEFAGDFARWQAQLDENLTFRFSDPRVLFAKSSDEITPRFREILSDFFPRYMNRIFPYHLGQSEVREIRIEGHTSSEWEGEADEKKAYLNNMELSQNRTRAILEYVLYLPEAEEYDPWARSLITANGLSSSRPVDEFGRLTYNISVEDETLSRRVEFRLLVSSCDRSETES